MKKIIHFINIFLTLIAICMSFLIFNRKNPNNLLLNKISLQIYNYLNIGDFKTEEASSTVRFIKIEGNRYSNNDYVVYAPFNGVIIQKKDTTIKMKLDNGYYCKIDNLLNIKVNKYDYVNCNDQIGNFTDFFIMEFEKNGLIYEYEEII